VTLTLDAQPPRRAHPGELVSALAALALLVLMFAFAWYGVDGIPGRTRLSSTEDAWNALAEIRWLMLLTILVAFAAPFVHAIRGSKRPLVDPGALACALGTVTSILLCYRVLIVPPSPAAVLDQKLGAYLGLVSCVTIAVAAGEGFLARRSRAAEARGRDPGADPTRIEWTWPRGT
jgi:hypothetical protein